MNYLESLKTNVQDNMKIYMSAVKSLYDNPELGNQEFKSMALLAGVLEDYGFEVETAYIVPTGFIGKYDSRKPGPTIAYLCEYDALPEVGHGCGHNLIAGIGVAAGVALKSVIDELGGQVWVVGTPAEENFGGKIDMVNGGVFDTVDVAMMIHPSTETGLGKATNAINPVKFEFFGKNAHGCTPYEGKSALDAAVLTYVGINMMRQFTERGTFIHGIVKEGGGAANVIPAYASLEYYFRAPKMSYVQQLTDMAIKYAEGACVSTGVELKTSIYEVPYEDFLINNKLCDLLGDAFSELGEDFAPVDKTPWGSSDIGSVSYKCPALHGYIKIAEKDVQGHSKEMASATISPDGEKGLLTSAVALAKIGVDLLQNPKLLEEVKAEFKKNTAE